MVHEWSGMSEKREYNQKLVDIGEALREKRVALGVKYSVRENFIEERSIEIFGGKNWISPRHLANIELGKNWIGLEKLIVLAYALEEDPVDLFAQILDIYNSSK